MIRLALTGSRGSGKTSLLLKLAQALRKRGKRVGGFVQPVVFSENERQGYDLQDLTQGQSFSLARRPANWQPGQDGFDFQEEAWDAAALSLQTAVRGGAAEICLVDELGRLEAITGGGHLPVVLSMLAAAHSCAWIFSVRKDVAPDLLPLLGVPAINMIDLDVTDQERILSVLLQKLAPPAKSDEEGPSTSQPLV